MRLESSAIFKAGKHNLALNKKSYVMGILNVTPDSFSDGGKWLSSDLAIKRALEIQRQGADILDIGAQSTRPGCVKISWQEELSRLIPVLKGIRGKVTIPISIDTFYPEVVEMSLELGAEIINNVTGFKNKKMFEVVSDSTCGLVVMHDGSNDTMANFFKNQLNLADKYNISIDRICLDPGIGFGKSYEENLFILGNVNKFRVWDCAILIGASRKRVIGMSCGNPPFENRLPGTISAHTSALLSGADIIRVHDVSEAVQSSCVVDKIIKYR